MLNQVVLVGRITNDMELREIENGEKVTNVTIAVQRSFKNHNGEYDVDFIDCTLWKGVAESMTEYCKKGDLVGVKGRVQTNNYEKNGEMKKSFIVVAEKVTFLSSKNKSDMEVEKER